MESASYGVFLMARMAKFSALAASTALVLTGFSPAMAAPMYPGTSVATPIEAGALGWSADNENAQGWRGYRGNRGYRGHRRHRGGIDGGDLLAGILVIGGKPVAMRACPPSNLSPATVTAGASKANCRTAKSVHSSAARPRAVSTLFRSGTAISRLRNKPLPELYCSPAEFLTGDRVRCAQATVNRNGLSIDIGRAVGCQKQRNFRHFAGRSATA